MSTLHIFNPDHDMALAADAEVFTPPHNIRCFCSDMAFLPALWADDGDVVLADDVAGAMEAVRHLSRHAARVRFATIGDVASGMAGHITSVSPWGWDKALARRLRPAADSLRGLMPDAARLSALRVMSHRRFAAERLLAPIVADTVGTVGESVFCASLDEVRREASRHASGVVLKMPWSSSGRGVRYAPAHGMDANMEGWTRNVIARQGGIMAEPRYANVMDFGMEFHCDAHDGIRYCGLSLFLTDKGAYKGGLIATEEQKRELLSHYADMTLVDEVRQRTVQTLQPLLSGVYEGPFGVDMMIVAAADGRGFRVHPCVELNLRRTMGHVAIAISPSVAQPWRVMSVECGDRCRVCVRETTHDMVNTSVARL